MAELDPAERIGAEDDYVRDLGHLPKSLMRSLRAGMLSGEPEHEAAAALRIKTLGDHDPALIEAIPEAERTRAAAIAEFAELGLKPARAVELGDERLHETWPRRPGEPEAPGGDFLLEPEDQIGDQRVPMVERSGHVWENGRWRPETREEARDKLQPLSAEEEGGDGEEEGGKGDKSPTDGAPMAEDNADDKITADDSKVDESEKDEPKKDKNKGGWDGLPPAISLFQGRTATIRDDDEGDGHYWTNRKDKNGKEYHHAGVDLDASHGEPVAFPVNGTVEMIGDPYDDKQYKSIWIRTESGHRIGMLYVTPHDSNGNQLVKPGDKIKAGDVIGPKPGDKIKAGDVIGSIQDITKRYPRMNNHTHFEVRKGKGRGKPLDPTPWLRSSEVIE